LTEHTFCNLPFWVYQEDSLLLNNAGFLSRTLVQSSRNKYCSQHHSLKLVLITEPTTNSIVLDTLSGIRLPYDTLITELEYVIYPSLKSLRMSWNTTDPLNLMHSPQWDEDVRFILQVEIHDMGLLDWYSHGAIMKLIGFLNEENLITLGCFCPHKTQNLIGSLFRAVKDKISVEVECPEGMCHGYKEESLWEMVIHLNDKHHWKRETIADWIEDVAEERGIDISFPTPNEIPKEPGES
jgi:hypothetical protein